MALEYEGKDAVLGYDGSVHQQLQKPKPLAPALAAGLLAGMAWQMGQPQLWAAAVYWALAAFGGFGVLIGVVLVRCAASSFTRRAAAGWVGVAALFAAGVLGGVAWPGLRALSQEATRLAPALEGRDVDVRALVAAMPQRVSGGLRLRLQVQSALDEGRPVAAPPLWDVGWYSGVWGAQLSDGEAVGLQRYPGGEFNEPQAGEVWQLRVRLRAPHGQRNPHGLDFELAQWHAGVQASGYVRATASDPAPQRLEQLSAWQAPGLAVERWRQQTRAQLGAAPHGQTAAAGVVTALVVGDQRAIDAATWELFRSTGVSHLMSISGLHITMFAWAAGALLAWVWRVTVRGALALGGDATRAWVWRAASRWTQASVAAWGGLLCALAYALFSGWEVPAQRTLAMLAVVVALRQWGLAWPWWRVWGGALLVVLVADPWAMLQAGFWLSFVAVAVLFGLSSQRVGGDRHAHIQQENAIKNASACAGFTAQSRENFFIKTLSFLKGASEAAQTLVREQVWIGLALAPLALVLFQELSLVGVVANLWSIPWVTLVLTPLALLAAALPQFWLQDAAQTLAQVAAQLLLWSLEWAAAWPWASVSSPAAPLWAGVGASLGAWALVAGPGWRSSLARRALGLSLTLPLVFWQSPRPAQGQFEVMALDVGQGNAVLVRTAQHTLLYDAGPQYNPSASANSDAGQRVVVPLLRALGVSLDALVVSHRDIDHVGGAAAILKKHPQAHLRSSLEPGHPVLGLASAQPCVAGQRWDWDGVLFEFLYPTADVLAASIKPNHKSCVLKVSNGPATALLLGDVETAQEAALAQMWGAEHLRADWVLVPHHGSKTSSTPELVAATQARFAVVQAGYRNRFAHPAPQVAQRWRAAGAQLVETAACGAAHWASHSKGVLRCERQENRRYWQHDAPPAPESLKMQP